MRIAISASLQLRQTTASLTSTLGVQTTGSGQSTQTQGTAHGFQLTWPNISIADANMSLCENGTWDAPQNCLFLGKIGENGKTWWTTSYSFFWGAIFSDKPISTNSVWISQPPFPASVSAGCFQGVSSSLAKLSENSGNWTSTAKSAEHLAMMPWSHWSHHIMSSQNLTRWKRKETWVAHGATHQSLGTWSPWLQTSWPASFNIFQPDGSPSGAWEVLPTLRDTWSNLHHDFTIFYNRHVYTLNNLPNDHIFHPCRSTGSTICTRVRRRGCQHHVASFDAIPWGEGCGRLRMECQTKAIEKYVQTFNWSLKITDKYWIYSKTISSRTQGSARIVSFWRHDHACLVWKQDHVLSLWK